MRKISTSSYQKFFPSKANFSPKKGRPLWAKEGVSFGRILLFFIL